MSDSAPTPKRQSKATLIIIITVFMVLPASALCVMGWLLINRPAQERPMPTPQLLLAPADQAIRVSARGRAVMPAPVLPADAKLMRLSDGAVVSLGDYQEDALVLVFWASWCPDCDRQMPHVEALHQQLAKDPSARVLSVSFREETRGPTPEPDWQERLKAEVAQRGYQVEVLVGAQPLADALSLRAIPAVVMVDKQRRVRLISDELELDAAAMRGIIDQLNAP